MCLLSRPTLTKEERYRAKQESFDNRTEQIKNHEDYFEIPGKNLQSAIKELNTTRPLAYLKQKVYNCIILSFPNGDGLLL